jgi:hypothetical protein
MGATDDLNLFNLSDLDDMGDFKAMPPEGDYVAKLLRAVGELSKKGSPQVICTFEILEGPQAGDELKAWYGVDVQDYVRKDGSPGKRSFGISRIKALLIAAGDPIPERGQIPTGSLKAAQVIAAKIVTKKLAGKKLVLRSKDKPSFIVSGATRQPKLDANGKQEAFRELIPVGLATPSVSEAADDTYTVEDDV